jgi:hypothetical protein
VIDLSMRWGRLKGDGTDITLVCSECSVTYKAQSGSHRDRRHCLGCAAQYAAVQKKAISETTRAVKRGLIKPAKGQQCADCGLPAKYLDHRDYTKPLEVDPVCAVCNAKRGGGKWKPHHVRVAPPVRRPRVRSEAPECAAITLMVAA